MSYNGRKKIYTIKEIDGTNVVSELNACLKIHFENMNEEQYLYDYSKGVQPVLDRTKQIRPEINNKIVVNIASQIESFKNGYFLTKPTFYVSRREDKTLADDINRLNDILYTSGKIEADNEVCAWFHKVGVGVLYVESDEENVMNCYALDPRNAFVAYDRDPAESPKMGVFMTVMETEDGNNVIHYDVFTKEKIFRCSGSAPQNAIHTYKPEEVQAVSCDSTEINALGEIPIIEYTYNRDRMGSFEPVLDLMDAINDIQSNRADGVAQFIQSLMVLTNCVVDENEDGEKDITKIREAGLIELKSTNQAPAKVDIITEQLDQSQTQTYMDDLVKQVFDVAGVPITSKSNTSDSSNNGAVYLRNGWASADTHARNTEDLFRKSNKYFDKILLKILEAKERISLLPSDISIQFSRNEMENMLVKTQVALNLKSLGMSPELVYERSGISYDPVGDVAKSREYAQTAFLLPNPEEITSETVNMEEPTSTANNTPSAKPGTPSESRKGQTWISGYWTKR